MSTRVTRSVWNLRCPHCSAIVPVSTGSDVGAYDAIEVEVDCEACGETFHTETIVLVVSSQTPDAAAARAARIRGTAESIAVPEDEP